MVGGTLYHIHSAAAVADVFHHHVGIADGAIEFAVALGHLAGLLQQGHQLTHVLQLRQVTGTHGVDNAVQGRDSLVDFLLTVLVVGSLEYGQCLVVLLCHAGKAVDGPGGILRHLHRQRVPCLLLLLSALGHEHQLTQSRLVDFRTLNVER